MNTKVTIPIRLLMFFAILLSFVVKSGAQTYELKISNENLVDSKTYQFDVYIKRTGTTPLELANVGFGIGIDVTTVNGGTLAFSIVSPGPTYSELNTSQQPASVGLGTAAQTTVVNGVTYRYMNVNARTNPGAGSGSIISNAGTCPANGTRIGRFQLTNTANFTANSTFKHVFSTAIGAGRNNTVISAYVGTTATVITNPSSNFNYNTAGTCQSNIVLNFACPTITLTPATGTAFPGGTTGTPYPAQTITAAGGTSPYTYLVTTGALPLGLTLSGAGVISGTPTAAGPTSFTITATDADSHACTGTANYTLNVVSGCAVTGTATTTPTSCAGASNGSASVTLSGTGLGTSGTYTVDGNPGGSFSGNPFTVSNLSAGTHSIIATYTVGSTCSSSAISANVAAGPTFSISGTGGSNTCFNATNGTASITASGGTGGTYTVDGGGALTYTGTSINLTNLSAGNHTVVATLSAADGGCTSNSLIVTVANTPQLTGTATTGSVTCNGQSNGSSTVTLSAGGGGTYTVDGAPAGGIAYSGNSFTISGLAAGTYTVVATSTPGCVSSNISVTINNVAALTGSSSNPQSPTCFGGSNGSALITLSAAGAAGSSYTVDSGSPISYTGSSFTVSGLLAGSHTVVATNSNGCTSNLIGVSITATPQITGTVNSTTPTTCGSGPTGTANITLTGSSSGNYSVDGGSATPYNSSTFTVGGLTGGPHSVVATSTPGGCASAPINFTIGGSAGFSASYTKTNVSACNNTNDGSITVTASGTGPTTYTWSGGYPGFAPGNVASVTNLPYGYYNVTVSNSCGSQTFSSIHVEQAYYVYITNSGSTANACGGSTGSIILYGNAGVSPYMYAVVAGSGQPNPAAGAYQASNTITGLAAGTYSAFIKDAAGCVSSKDITLGSAAPITVSPYVRSATSCSNDGSIEVYRSGGTPPYTYALQVGSNPVGSFQASNTFSGLAAGSYTTYVKDASGCVASASATIAQGAALTVTTLKNDRSSCQQDGSAQINASGGTAPYTYSFNGSAYSSTNLFTGLDAGTYPVSAKDSKGCIGNSTVTINTNTITVTASPTASTTCTSNNGKIQVFRTGGVGPYTYSLDGNTYQTSQLFQNLTPGTYTAFVKDSKTCSASLSGIVVGPSGCTPRIANPTTRNSNSKVSQVIAASSRISAYPNPSNSEFTLQLSGYNSKEKVSITVTDVLGRKVYQTDGTGKTQYSFGAGFINGMYNVQVTQGSDNKSLKLVKE